MPPDGSAPNAPDGAPAPRCHVEGFTLGPFETNCYILTVENAAADEPSCWIIDASFEPQDLIDRVNARGLRPAALILTHAHVDHIAGVAAVRSAFPGLPIWIHEAEREWLSNPMLNLSAMMGMSITSPGPDRLLVDGETLTLGGLKWTVLHTPGHSPGGITLYNEPTRTAIVGDALFAGSIGRTDFPGSDHETLANAIRTKLYTLPDDTTIYPGHGPTSTIGREKRTNPFVRA